MNWLQILLLAFSILAGLLGAAWAIFRPLLKQVIQTMVVEPIAALRTEIARVHTEHGAKIRDLELEQARMRGALEASRCPAVTPRGAGSERCGS